MGEIYHKAQHVIVWVGDSDEHTGTVWNLMEDLRLILNFSASQTYHLALGWKPERFVPVPTAEGPYPGRGLLPLPPELSKSPPANHDSWRHMEAFLNRAWFERVWTLQEVVLSTSCYVVCGERTMWWDDLCRAAVALHLGGYTQFLGHGNASIILRHNE